MMYELALVVQQGLMSPCLGITTLTGSSHFMSMGDKVSSKEVFVGSCESW